MALIVTPTHLSQQLWRDEQPEDLINVFLKMWDGKVRIFFRRGMSNDACVFSRIMMMNILCTHDLFLKRKTLCCLINPRQAAITSMGILEGKVFESYPDGSRQDFFFECQSKPLNERTFNLLTWKDGTTIFVQSRQKGGCFIFSFTILCIIFMAIIGSFCTCGSSLLIIPILLPFLFILPLFCM